MKPPKTLLETMLTFQLKEIVMKYLDKIKNYSELEKILISIFKGLEVILNRYKKNYFNTNIEIITEVKYKKRSE